MERHHRLVNSNHAPPWNVQLLLHVCNFFSFQIQKLKIRFVFTSKTTFLHQIIFFAHLFWTF